MPPILQSGDTVSRYRVVSFIGAGGMGEVYKAHDTTLERAVALKILPPQLVASSEAIRRFVHEAKTASALNHPHIVTIHEIGTAGANVESAVPLHYIAMELIEGESLRQKMGADIDLPKMLDYLGQVADGVAKAHAAGIVHRDLKPENVMISVDGYAKVVDFGLAKLVERNLAEISPTDATSPIALTGRGVLLGTVGYMSPEQIEGHAVDERSDIFSFGCVIYEAVTGTPPFHADSVSATLHRIVHEAPTPLNELRHDAPEGLQRIVRKCLAKNPDERYQSMRDVAVDLREVRAELTSGQIAVRARTREWRTAAVLVAAAVTLLAAVALIVSRRAATPPPPVPETYTLSQLTVDGRVASGDVSPDGKYIAYASSEEGEFSVFLRQVKQENAVRLLGPDPVIYNGVRFSGDGTHLYYGRIDPTARERGRALRIPLLGGTPQDLFSDPNSHIASSPDGTRIIFRRHNPATKPHKDELRIADADGSKERVLLAIDEPGRMSHPEWSRDGTRILWPQAKDLRGTSFTVQERQVASGQQRTIVEGWNFIHNVVEQTDDQLLVIGKKTQSDSIAVWQLSRVSGTARRLTPDPNIYIVLRTPRDGAFIVTQMLRSEADLWEATATTSRQLTSGTANEAHLRVSPAGTIAYERWIGERTEVRVRKSDGTEQLISVEEYGANPVPTIDGTAVVFTSRRSGAANLWLAKLDGSRPAQLTRMQSAHYPDVTPDGKSVVFVSFDYAAKATLWKVPLSGGPATRLTSVYAESASVSPDGKHIAALHWVEEPETPKVLVLFSVNGGAPLQTVPLPWSADLDDVRWSRDGKSITYVDNRPGSSNVYGFPLRGGEPRKLTSFTDKLRIGSFDWSPDGKTVYCTRGKISSDLYLLEREEGPPKREVASRRQ